MTYLAQRLADLRRYLDHIGRLRDKVAGPEALERDLSLHNDVLFSLLMICQMVIDVCGELSTRAGLRFADYTEAVANLRKIGGFPEQVIGPLSRLPGFRNVIVHEYVAMNYERVVEALRQVEPIEEFVRIVAQRESDARRERG